MLQNDLNCEKIKLNGIQADINLQKKEIINEKKEVELIHQVNRIFVAK